MHFHPFKVYPLTQLVHLLVVPRQVAHLPVQASQVKPAVPDDEVSVVVYSSAHLTHAVDDKHSAQPVLQVVQTFEELSR